MFNNYLFLVLLLISTTTLSAQITLNADNYGSRDSVFLQDSVFLDSTLFASPPLGGADQVWDYSDVDINLYSVNTNEPIGEDTCFAGASSTNYFDANFQGFIYPIKNYEATTESGRYSIGQKVEQQNFSLLQVTGNPADTLTFLSDASVTNFPHIRFPATYGSSTVDSTEGVAPFALTVAAFGLNRTPGAQKTLTVIYQDIIGYGTIILPQRDGSVTEPLEVLLMRDSTVRTDTYTLGGGPAPMALLQAFGLMEVNVAIDVDYTFHVKGLGRAVARMYDVIDNGVVKYQMSLRTIEPGTTTAVRNHELLNLTLFPNPVNAGGSIKLAGQTELTAGNIRLLDLQGRVVSQKTFTPHSGGAPELIVPASAKAGLYFYQLSNLHGRPVGMGKVMVW